MVQEAIGGKKLAPDLSTRGNEMGAFLAFKLGGGEQIEYANFFENSNDDVDASGGDLLS